MNEQVKEYLEKFPCEITDLFGSLRSLIYDSVKAVIKETLWTKLPSYYVGDSFVRLIAFKEHINIEAKAIVEYKEELTDYKITPKGMLQIFVNQKVPTDVLKQIFAETLN